MFQNRFADKIPAAEHLSLSRPSVGTRDSVLQGVTPPRKACGPGLWRVDDPALVSSPRSSASRYPPSRGARPHGGRFRRRRDAHPWLL